MVQGVSHLIFTVGCIVHSSQALLQRRQCAFQSGKRNNSLATFSSLGNVTGSIQVCENTECCVAFFEVINNQTELDILACNIGENSCPDTTCKPVMLYTGKNLKCVCNADLCNSNITITWPPETPRDTYSYSADKIMIFCGIPLIGTITFMIVAFILRFVAANQRRLVTEIEVKLQSSPHDDIVGDLCSCQSRNSSEIDTADIELKQILDRGHFATVWRGEYQGATVAVKVFSSDWNERFSAEKEIYELPLMKHAGIAHFLGSGRKPDKSGFIVLQLAEYGSLHSYLCEHTTSWMLSLKLCQSLSEGLSYLHSDLRRDDVHKPSVAHRDLSSSNILVRADGSCVLCDFDCSTILRSCSRSKTTVEGHAQMGTLRYMSPEILEGFVNLSNSLCLIQGDIYSLGLLLWEIWMRCSDLFQGGKVTPHLLPYEHELGPSVTLEGLVQLVYHMQKRPTIPKHWARLPQGSALQDLLSDCWDCDPDARLTVPCVLDRLSSLQSCSLRDHCFCYGADWL